MCAVNYSKVPRNLMAIGMLCLAVGLVLPNVISVTGQSAQEGIHFCRGVLIGMALSLNIGALIKGARLRS